MITFYGETFGMAEERMKHFVGIISIFVFALSIDAYGQEMSSLPFLPIGESDQNIKQKSGEERITRFYYQKGRLDTSGIAVAFNKFDSSGNKVKWADYRQAVDYWRWHSAG